MCVACCAAWGSASRHYSVPVCVSVCVCMWVCGCVCMCGAFVCCVCVCMCVYVCGVFVCVYVCGVRVCVCMCVCVWCVCVLRLCVYVCVCVWCVCVCVCVWCMCVCVYVCECVWCVCLCVYMCVLHAVPHGGVPPGITVCLAREYPKASAGVKWLTTVSYTACNSIICCLVRLLPWRCWGSTLVVSVRKLTCDIYYIHTYIFICQ